MPKSRKRKKPKAERKPPRGWWAQNRTSVYQGIGGGLLGGCLPVLAIAVIVPMAIVL